MVTVRVRRNGPCIVDGDDVRVVTADGTEVRPSKLPVALCRCGASQAKPFCDRSHARIGFCPDGEAEDNEGRLHGPGPAKEP